MASSFPGAISQAGILIPALESRKTQHHKIYTEHCHRIYSLAFWMSDHELVAEQLSEKTFLRAFASSDCPRAEQIDQAFLAELQDLVPLHGLDVNVPPPVGARLCGNVKRVHLERAVVQLPASEKLIFLLHDVEGYEHGRISRLLAISEDESKLGLHHARLRIHELLAKIS